jgi:4-oxalocrotonate tautomerase
MNTPISGVQLEQEAAMPFINVKVAGQPLEQRQVAEIQKGITSLMADVLHKVGPLVGVLVEQVPLAGWSVGAAPVTRAAQIDAIVSAGTNTPEEKARFIAEANKLLKSVLGPDLSEVAYIVVHDVPKDSWGYNGLTQLDRAKQHKDA